MKTPTRVRSGFCPVRSGFKFFFECPVRFRSVLKTPVRSFTDSSDHNLPGSSGERILPSKSGFGIYISGPAVNRGPTVIAITPQHSTTKYRSMIMSWSSLYSSGELQ
eukprot:sb/3477717/